MGRFQSVFQYVVAANFEVVYVLPDQEARVEVGCHYAPLQADSSAQPAGHGAVTGADVEASPARAYTRLGQSPGGDRISDLSQKAQPLALEGVGALIREIVGFHHLCPSK
jgi:hypothetical protein